MLLRIEKNLNIGLRPLSSPQFYELEITILKRVPNTS